jgi:hypothetical protein
LREIEKATRSGDLIRDVHIRPEVIRATMDKLGESEFQTLTGFEMSEAEELLERLAPLS